MAQALTVRLPDKFPHIEFRNINGERVACLKGRLEVWQAVMAARRYDEAAKAAEH